MKKKTSSKKTSFAYEIWDAIKKGFTKAFSILAKIFLAIWVFIKIFAKGLLLFLEKIFQFIVALLLAFAKIIRAFAIAFFTLFLSLMLLALTFFLVARGVDLRNSESFRELRDHTFEICNDWLEPSFIASQARANAWNEYYEALKEAYRAKVSSAEKEKMVLDAQSELHSKLQEQDSNIFSWLR